MSRAQFSGVCNVSKTIASPPRVLMLAPDPFGVGGIERATRAMVDALADGGGQRAHLAVVWREERGAVANAVIVDAGVERRGLTTVPLRRQVGYVVRVLRYARRRRDQHDAVVACHAHLAPVAWMCRRITGRPYLVWCHGKEAWGRFGIATRLAVRAADHVISGSEFTATRLVENGLVAR